MIPAVWRRVMDRRVIAHYGGDAALANVQPRARRRYPERPLSRYRCPGCGYVYDEREGHAREGFPPGTIWEEIPDDWACADCGVRDKVDFEQDG